MAWDIQCRGVHVLIVSLLVSRASGLANIFDTTDINSCLVNFGVHFYSPKSHYSGSPSHCAVICEQIDGCFQFIYCRRPGTKNCYPVTLHGISWSENRAVECSCYHKVAPDCENGGELKHGQCDCPTGFYGSRCEHVLESCLEAKAHGITKTKSLMIKPPGSDVPIPLLCDNSHNHSYTVIQQRVTIDLTTDKKWLAYRKGFGTFKENFWIGFDQINLLLSKIHPNILEAGLLCDIGETGIYSWHTVSFSEFLIGSDTDNYRIHLKNFSSKSENADILNDFFSFVDGQQFSTLDHDSSSSLCPVVTHSGWWFSTECVRGNLNACNNNDVLSPANETVPVIVWQGSTRFLRIKETYMKIRSE